ncbi:MAG: hypothetical protein ABI407_22045 [Bradyrhizobium sp.]
MRFADDGILRNLQAVADVRRGETFVPELAQLRDGDVGPSDIVLHRCVLLFRHRRKSAGMPRPASGSTSLPSVPPNGRDAS